MPEGLEIKEKTLIEICAKSLESKVFDLVELLGQERKRGLQLKYTKI